MAQLPPFLLLDNEADDLFIVKRLIAKAGVENKAVTFEEPLVAVSYLEAEIRTGNELMIPFLIFTDLNMPTMDGFEFSRWVRSQPALKNTYLVMLTSSESPADATKALAAGVDRFVSKYPTALGFRQLAAAAGAKLAPEA
jgi:CheY-like chemotaxis protein